MTAPVVTWLGKVKTVAQTAAAGLPNPYTDVAIAAPVPRGRCVRVWWAGEEIPAPQMDGVRYSLSSEIVGQRIAATAFEPLSDSTEQVTAAAMASLGEFVHAMRAAVNADRTFGDTAMSVEMPAVDADYLNVGGAILAYATCLLVPGITEYAIGGGS